jgi:hypothetical protein
VTATYRSVGRRRLGRHAGACDDDRRAADAREIVGAEVDLHAFAAERRRVALERVARSLVGHVHAPPAAREQARGGAAALGEADHRGLAGLRVHHPAGHRRALSAA